MEEPQDSQEADDLTVQAQIDNSLLQEMEPLYSNHIQVYPTPNEIVLNFGRIDIPGMTPSEMLEDEIVTLEAKPVVRVVIPYQQFEPFAELVARQYKRWLTLIQESSQTEDD